jgi:hypothetical protein
MKRIWRFVHVHGDAGGVAVRLREVLVAPLEDLPAESVEAVVSRKTDREPVRPQR